jgi:hypothetical protein
VSRWGRDVMGSMIVCWKRMSRIVVSSEGELNLGDKDGGDKGDSNSGGWI